MKFDYLKVTPATLKLDRLAVDYLDLLQAVDYEEWHSYDLVADLKQVQPTLRDDLLAYKKEYDKLYELYGEESLFQVASIFEVLKLFKLVTYMTSVLHPTAEALFLAYNVAMFDWARCQTQTNRKVDRLKTEVLDLKSALHPFRSHPRLLDNLEYYKLKLEDGHTSRTFSLLDPTPVEGFIERCISLQTYLNLDQSPYVEELGLTDFFLRYKFNTENLVAFKAWYEDLSPEGFLLFQTDFGVFLKDGIGVHATFLDDFQSYLTELKCLYADLHRAFSADLKLQVLARTDDFPRSITLNQRLYLDDYVKEKLNPAPVFHMKGWIEYRQYEGRFIGFQDCGLQISSRHDLAFDQVYDLLLDYLNDMYEVID